jgi:hypothetical protein
MDKLQKTTKIKNSTIPSEMFDRVSRRMQEYYLGRDYWYEYVRINGFSMEPKDKELSALAKSLELKVSQVRRCIYKFLEE